VKRQHVIERLVSAHDLAKDSVTAPARREGERENEKPAVFAVPASLGHPDRSVRLFPEKFMNRMGRQGAAEAKKKKQNHRGVSKAERRTSGIFLNAHGDLHRHQSIKSSPRGSTHAFPRRGARPDDLPCLAIRYDKRFAVFFRKASSRGRGGKSVRQEVERVRRRTSKQQQIKNNTELADFRGH